MGKDEPRRWAEIAKLLFVPFTENDVIEQFEGFDSLRRYHNPRQATPPYQRTDWVSERNGDTVDAWQIVKQPDVPMLFYLLGQRRVVALLRNAGYKFSEAVARRTIDYYLARITHESTLSKVVCAGAIAPSDKELSLRYFKAALATDFMPRMGSAKEGVRLGAMSGVLDVLVRQYAGIEFADDAILLRPCWPQDLPPVRVSLRFQQQLLRLHATPEFTTLQADKRTAGQ
ncbi:protein of unknown function (plasmid) [Caballeronia sp. S22]